MLLLQPVQRERKRRALQDLRQRRLLLPAEVGLREPAAGRVALLQLVQVGQQQCHLPLRRPLAVYQLQLLLPARQQEPKSRQQAPLSVCLLRLQAQAVEQS